MMKSPEHQLLNSLDQRSREIFRLVVESYLNDGDPVGSRNLSRLLPHSLSPATIRNVMSDLEHLGLIYAPHISAGRLPTQIGLRFSLMPLWKSAIWRQGNARPSRRRCAPPATAIRSKVC